MNQPTPAMSQASVTPEATHRPRGSWGEPWHIHGALRLADAGVRGPAGQAAGEHRFAVPATLLQGVVTLATGRGESAFVALLAAYALLCKRFSAGDDVLISSPVLHGRVWHATLAGDPSFEDLLERVGDAVDHPRGLPAASAEPAGLSLSWQASSEALLGCLRYDPALYGGEAVASFAGHYLELLGEIVAAPSRSLSRLAA